MPERKVYIVDIIDSDEEESPEESSTDLSGFIIREETESDTSWTPSSPFFFSSDSEEYSFYEE